MFITGSATFSTEPTTAAALMSDANHQLPGSPFSFAGIQSRLRKLISDPDQSDQDIEDVVRQDASVWRILFENSNEGVVILNREGRVIDANPAFAIMLGYPREEVYQLHVWDWEVIAEQHEILRMLGDLRPTGEIFETRHRRKDGRVIDVELKNTSVWYDGEKLIFCLCRDITERKETERRMQQLVSTDALTGLLNRREFSRLMEHELSEGARNNAEVSVLLLDIDHFKCINDRFGHHVGDEVLIKVAKSLRITVRRSDCISRWGGEEFLILLPCCGLEDAVQMAEKLRLSISHIQLPDGHSVSASVGAAGWLVGETSMEFIKRADAAMYQAKANGRDRVSWTSV